MEFGFKELIQGINLPKLLENDAKMWRATLRVGDTVPAGTMLPTTLNISNRGVFLCLSLTGRFSTLELGAESAIVDNGICDLSMAIKNGSGRVYIQDPVFLDCLFTPGRIKASISSGDAANQLQFPGLPWVTCFRPTDILTHEVTNDATADNEWQLNYHGVWISQ